MLRKLRNLWVTPASGLNSLLALLVASFILVAECAADAPAKDTPTLTSGQSESISSEAELAELIRQLKEPQSACGRSPS